MTMTQTELKEIVRLHKLWLLGDKEGKKANLSSADMSFADMSFADLRCANLSSADMSAANLRSANLRSADLRSADLRSANLRSANLRCAANVVSVTGIGSERRMTTYRADTDEIWCGCFKGTLAGFAKKVKETHKDNPDHLAHYLAAVAFFKAYKKNVKPIEKKQQRARNEQSH